MTLLYYLCITNFKMHGENEVRLSVCAHLRILHSHNVQFCKLKLEFSYFKKFSSILVDFKISQHCFLTNVKISPMMPL